jgi:hypothetical protein
MSEPKELRETPPARPMTAWEAAAAEGIDMSLIEEGLRLTPEQRILQHGYALTTLEMLEKGRNV